MAGGRPRAFPPLNSLPCIGAWRHATLDLRTAPWPALIVARLCPRAEGLRSEWVISRLEEGAHTTLFLRLLEMLLKILAL